MPKKDDCIIGASPKTEKGFLRKLKEPEWEAQDGETALAYSAFSMYLRMGDKRSYKSLCFLQNRCNADDDDITIHNAVACIRNIASQNRWSERLKKYEQYLNEQAAKEEIESKKRILKRHERILEAAENVMTMPLTDALKRIKNGELKLNEVFQDNFSSVDEKRLRLARQSIETFIKIVATQRTAIGEPTDIINSDITTKGNRIKVIIPSIPDIPDNE